MLSPSLRYFFCLLPYTQVFTFIFPYLFYFIVFSAYNAFLLSPNYNVSGLIVVTTGFPGMGPFSILLGSFIMATTDISQKFLIPAFAYIWVNMTFVATFIK